MVCAIFGTLCRPWRLRLWPLSMLVLLSLPTPTLQRLRRCAAAFWDAMQARLVDDSRERYQRLGYRTIGDTCPLQVPTREHDPPNRVPNRPVWQGPLNLHLDHRILVEHDLRLAGLAAISLLYILIHLYLFLSLLVSLQFTLSSRSTLFFR